MGSELESIGTSGISRDRSLERAFEFDEINEPLPRAKDLLKTRRGKKKVRNVKGGDEQEDKRSYNERFGETTSNSDSPVDDLDPISRLRIFVTGGSSSSSGPSSGLSWFRLGDDLTFIKVVEKATWAGIAGLVIWEAYINSPLFERAAPMAPVVY
ncbi:hypothetical protein TrCOL_g6975 [Triparma columacea]|uniref:Uncharacterized protein n=1 Tax=Triparma columacea TaxID=722753 RepID=A0A9W7G8P0_9STRA|nr:hypothetical protein TrCOL_g6975 [Triparma columacea]